MLFKEKAAQTHSGPISSIFFPPLKMASFRRQLEGFVVVVFAFNLVSLCRTNGAKFGMLCYNVFISSQGMLSKVARRVLPNTLSVFPVGKRAGSEQELTVLCDVYGVHRLFGLW